MGDEWPGVAQQQPVSALHELISRCVPTAGGLAQQLRRPGHMMLHRRSKLQCFPKLNFTEIPQHECPLNLVVFRNLALIELF